MAIALRASAVVQTKTDATSYTLTLPSLTDGDMMVMVVYGKHGTDPAPILTPAGWTLLYTDPIQFDQGRYAAFYRRKIGGEANPVLDFQGVTMIACYAVLGGFYESGGGTVDVYAAGKGAVNTPNAAQNSVYPAVTPFDAGADCHLLLGSVSATDVGAGPGDASGQGFTKIQALQDGGADEGAAALYYDLAGSDFAQKTVANQAVSYYGAGAVALTASPPPGGGSQGSIAAATSAW